LHPPPATPFRPPLDGGLVTRDRFFDFPAHLGPPFSPNGFPGSFTREKKSPLTARRKRSEGKKETTPQASSGETGTLYPPLLLRRKRVRPIFVKSGPGHWDLPKELGDFLWKAMSPLLRCNHGRRYLFLFLVYAGTA